MSLASPAVATVKVAASSSVPVAHALPLPTGAWGAADAFAALAAARPALPVPLPEPELVSALTTVVLRAGGYAVKVYPPGTDAAHLDRTARALAGSRSAHVAPCRAVTTPHGVVTLTTWLQAHPDAAAGAGPVPGAPAPGAPVTWPELGGLLRSFHEEHAGADLPRWTPLSRLPGQAQALPAELAEVLLDARTTLLSALREVRSELGDGVIHGDVSPGNVLRTEAGPRLIDLDWAAVAPREYDLAAAARRLRSGEIDAAAYAGFCAGYGADVRGWTGLPVLDRVAELGGLVFRLWDDRHHGRDLAWLPAAVAPWRTPL